MPFTPFHFGPGALIAAASRSRVSFLAFTATNVLIDVESLYNMVTDQPRIHAFFHTYAGSTLAAAGIVLAFIPCRAIAHRLPAWPVPGWRRLGVLTVLYGSLLGAMGFIAPSLPEPCTFSVLAPGSLALSGTCCKREAL